MSFDSWIWKTEQSSTVSNCLEREKNESMEFEIVIHTSTRMWAFALPRCKINNRNLFDRTAIHDDGKKGLSSGPGAPRTAVDFGPSVALRVQVPGDWLEKPSCIIVNSVNQNYRVFGQFLLRVLEPAETAAGSQVSPFDCSFSLSPVPFYQKFTKVRHDYAKSCWK